MVCVNVGSTLVLTGEEGMSGGTHPGPPIISDRQTLVLVSSRGGTSFTGVLRAVRSGSAAVTVPFVAGSASDCNPTPCTPVPGMPMVWQVTVVG